MISVDDTRQISAANRKRALGLGFIVIAATIWVLASFIVQEVEDEGLSPFLLSYIANSLFIVYLPLDYILKRGASGKLNWTRLEDGARRQAEEEDSALEGAGNPPAPQLWGYFDRELLRAASVVAPLWFLAQFTFNTSLHLTSVTSNTILSSTASLFTYGLSWLLLKEAFVAHKLASIIVSATGTSIVTLADRSNSQRPSSAAGDALCLLSAVFYAAYTVAIKKMLPGDEDTNVMLFFGYVGLLNLVGLAPVLLLLQLTSLVNVAQISAAVFGLVVAKGLLDNVLSDYLWARAVLLIGPTVATVGMSIQVPLAVVLDILWERPEYVHNAGSVLVMVLGGWYVLAGFVGVNVVPRQKSSEPSKLAAQADVLE